MVVSQVVKSKGSHDVVVVVGLWFSATGSWSVASSPLGRLSEIQRRKTYALDAINQIYSYMTNALFILVLLDFTFSA